jgi:hypothetical protein
MSLAIVAKAEFQWARRSRLWSAGRGEQNFLAKDVRHDCN